MSDPFRSGAFEALTTEQAITPCTLVAGALPPGFTGRYVRNGPNSPVAPAGPYVYPIDGDGMLHEVAFPGDGTVTYRRAFVRTPMLEAELAAGRALWGTVMMGLQPLPGSGATGRKDIPDVNVLAFHGQLLALAEQTCSYEVDPHSLATGMQFPFAGQFPRGATAHPKVDPTSGNLVVFSYGFAEPYLAWCELASDGSVITPHTAIAGLDYPAMIHDCAITPRYLVIPVYPLVFDPLRTVTTDGPPLQWQPDRLTRIAVVERATGRTTWLTTHARWSWHTVNAVEGPSGITLDVMSYDDFAMEDRLGALERLELNLENGNVTCAIAAERAGEFPRIDDRLVGQGYRTLASVSNAGAARYPGTFDTLVEIDAATGADTRWTSSDSPLGEPVFIPAGEGYWGVLTAAPEGRASHFLVFAAGDVSRGPIATVRLPSRVPAGLHGTWLATS